MNTREVEVGMPKFGSLKKNQFINPNVRASVNQTLLRINIY